MATGPASDEPTRPIDPAVARRVVLGFVALAALGVVGFALLRKPPPPPPADVAADPLLSAGHAVFAERCVSCHGPEGKGDGPIAKGLAGPKVGNLAGPSWRHGEAPEAVLAVIRRGTPDTAMPGWADALGEAKVRAVAAYVYYLGKRPVPAALCTP